MQALSPHVAFEIAAGLNGRVWVKGDTPEDTILVCNAIQSSEHMTHPVAEAFVKQLVTRMPRSSSLVQLS
jgi:exosome complex component RRP40